MISWDGMIESAATVPTGLWVLASVVAVIGTWRLAGRRMHRAGQRTRPVPWHVDLHLTGVFGQHRLGPGAVADVAPPAPADSRLA